MTSDIPESSADNSVVPNPTSHPSFSEPTPSTISHSDPRLHVHRRRLISILLIITGIILIIVIALLILYFGFIRISRADYEKAQTTLNNVIDASQKSEDAITNFSNLGGTTSKSDFDRAISIAQSSLDTYKNQNAALANLKALQNKEVKAKYNVYMNKYSSYYNYINSMLQSYRILEPGILALDNLNNDTTSSISPFISALKSAKSAFDTAKTAPNKDAAMFANAAAPAIDSALTYAEKLQADENSQAPYSVQSNDYKQLLGAVNQLGTAANTFETNVQQSAAAIDPTQAANNLSDVINAKANK